MHGEELRSNSRAGLDGAMRSSIGMEEQMDWTSFLDWEKASRTTIDFKVAYVDMTGDVLAGLLLSQIVYWHLPSKAGASKLRIVRDGKVWLAKAYGDWYDEIRLTFEQARRTIGILKEKGIVETEIFKFGGTPMVHIHLVQERFLELYAEAIKGPQVNLCSDTSPLVLEHKSSSEITAQSEDVLGAEASPSTPRDVSKPTSTRGNGSPPVVSKEPTPPTSSRAGQSSKTRPAQDTRKVSHRGAKTPYEALMDTLAIVTKLDTSVARANGRLRSAASQLKKAGYTPEQVRKGFGEGCWWYLHDFRGQKGQPPTPENVLDLILQAKEAQGEESYYSPITYRFYKGPAADEQRRLDQGGT